MKEYSHKLTGRFTDCGKYAIFECSVCSMDAEMFPEGSLVIGKYRADKDNTVCPCSGMYRYSIDQFRVMLDRREKTDLIGWRLVGDYPEKLKSSTKLEFINEDTSKIWSTTFNLFKKGAIPQDFYGRSIGEIVQRSDESNIKDFVEAGFSKEYNFRRNFDKLSKEGTQTYWYYDCPDCKEDFYTFEGCGYTFTTLAKSLREGKKNCRCVKGHHFSLQERVCQVSKLLEPLGGSLVRLDGSVTASYFTWECPEGHINRSQVWNLLNEVVGCKVCRENVWGLYKEKLNDQDYFYVMTSETRHGKVGRTFHVNNRLRQVSSSNSIDFSVHKLVTGSHKEIFKLEKEVLQVLSEEGLRNYEMVATTEGFYIKDLEVVLDIIDKCMSKFDVHHLDMDYRNTAHVKYDGKKTDEVLIVSK